MSGKQLATSKQQLCLAVCTGPRYHSEKPGNTYKRFMKSLVMSCGWSSRFVNVAKEYAVIFRGNSRSDLFLEQVAILSR